MIYVLESEYQGYDGGSHTTYGYTKDEERAKAWVIEMQARATHAAALMIALGEEMRQWTLANPRPVPGSVANTVKPLLKVPKKERTADQSLAIQVARRNDEEASRSAYRPMQLWTERWSAERERRLALIPPAIREDMERLPSNDDWFYTEVKELT
jgi:hypothetical protein